MGEPDHDHFAIGAGATPLTQADLAQAFAACAGFSRVLLAVSGGADSMALMHLARDWAASCRTGPSQRLQVATVDHGLRPEAASEALWVGARAAEIGLSHHILRWEGPKPATGIQSAARTARYSLLSATARALGCGAIVTAHTRDDQAETFLMRLARASAVDGLAGMRAVSEVAGMPLVRPLLGVTHDQLIATLRSRRVDWLEDPSNADIRFERVKLRRARPARDTLGLTDAHLTLTAKRLDRARQALDHACLEFARAHLQLNDGAFCRIPLPRFLDLPEEIALRVVTRVIAAYGGSPSPPRLCRIERLTDGLRNGVKAATLGGCRFEIEGGAILAVREPGRRGLPQVGVRRGGDVLWDGRFQIGVYAADADAAAPGSGSLVVRALGPDGLALLRSSASRDGTVSSGTPFARVISGWPRLAMPGLPSVWCDDVLVAVPHLGNPGNGDADCGLPLQGVVRFLFDGAHHLARAPVPERRAVTSG